MDVDDNNQSRHTRIDSHLYQADIPEYISKFIKLFVLNFFKKAELPKSLTNAKEVK